MESALRQFRSETGTYPYQGEQSSVADTADLAQGRANRLWFFLGTPMSAAQQTAIRTDLAAVSTAFAYNLRNSAKPTDIIKESYNAGSMTTFAFKGADISPGPALYNPVTARFEASGLNAIYTTPASDYRNLSRAAYLNRLATERYRLAVLAGNPTLRGWRSEAVYDTGVEMAVGAPGRLQGRS